MRHGWRKSAVKTRIQHFWPKNLDCSCDLGLQVMIVALTVNVLIIITIKQWIFIT